MFTAAVFKTCKAYEELWYSSYLLALVV